MKNLLPLLLITACSSITRPITKPLDLNKVAQIGASSKIAKYKWPQRGVLPVGYVKGMAVSYAKNICKPIKNLNGGKGALEHYDLSRSQRSLFSLLVGLGPRESSGRHCTGRDTTNPRPSSEGAEAGLFQTSWNARNVPAANGNKAATEEMIALFKHYSTDKSQCFLEFFKEGVTCTQSNWANYGSGDGAAYQKLAKECPGFHVEFTALTVLNTHRHHGPIVRKEVEIKAEAYEMLDAVEKFVKENGCTP